MIIENFAKLEEHNIPFVIAGNPYTSFNGSMNIPNMGIVQINNRMGIQLTIKHLLETGRKNIAFIGGPPMQSDAEERKSAYAEAIKKHHVPIIADIGGEELFWQRGYLSAKQLLTANSGIDSIISYDDNVALGAMKYLSDHNIRIPEDIAVTGFDNQPFSGYSIPSLTTVHQPTDEIGKASVILLEKLISHQPISENHIYIKPSLVIRSSTTQ
jgi:DNA-binding LacI/PurR family transcriptional regulator